MRSRPSTAFLSQEDSLTEPVLLVHRADGVLTLTLNRPEKRNALSTELWDALREQVRAAGDDPDLRCLVVAGAGGAFCAGADLSDLSSHQHPIDRMRVVDEIMLGLHELPVPTVAKVDGVAVGAGWNLALCCDLVAATPRSRFSQIFARRGLSLDSGGSWLLPRLVGLQRAKRLTFLADMVEADEALALGLVTWIRPEDEIDAFVDDLGRRLAAGPRVALAQSKALLHEGSQRTFAESLASEARVVALNLATEDTRLAYEAFRDQRPPNFTGRWRHGG